MRRSIRRRLTAVHAALAAAALTVSLQRPALSQTHSPAAEEAAVQAARAAFAVIGRELPTYRRVERRSDDSSPGALIVGFYRGADLRKVEITQGGANVVREECYFDGGQLVFRYRDARVATEGASAAVRREDRYYFAKGKLVRWVGSDGQRVPRDYPSFPVAERETLEGLKPVLAALASARGTFDPLDPPSALLHTDWGRSLEVKATKLENSTLAHVLLYGERVDIKNSDKQSLNVSLWSAGVETSCGRAGHMICGYRYFLAVADPGEGGDMVVYNLGDFGTIEKAEWQPTSDDRPRLQLVALNYPAHVFEYWTGVDRERGTFVLSIGTDSLAVRRSRPAR